MLKLERSRVQSFEINCQKKPINVLSVQNFTIASTNKKDDLAAKEFELQREGMLDEINKLKGELIFLMEAQIQSSPKKEDNSIRETEANPNLNTEASKGVKVAGPNEEEKLPPLQNIFTHNGKYLVLDAENFVWHLKKCKKYKKFVELNLDKFNGNREEVFNAYFEDSIYENETNAEKEKEKQIEEIPKQVNQHMFITENYIEENEQNNDIGIKNDEGFDKANQPKVDFDISDISNIVNEIDKSKIKRNDRKNEEKMNSSLDFSDDG